MTHPKLTVSGIRARPVLVPLKRPIVSRVGLFQDWPLILIDLETAEGVVGRSYLEPYLELSARYIVPMIEDLAQALKGQRVAPFDTYKKTIGSLHLVGREGLSLIAVSALDMAAWDALAQAGNMPLAEYLGGTIGPVPAYNSNGLWLTPLEGIAREADELIREANFSALKLRLGRDKLSDDLACIAAVREAVGADVKLMCDFNQGLTLGDALARCHALDDHGLYWFEEPITYDNIPGYAQLARELKTPVQLGENFYGPRQMYHAVLAGAGDLVMPDMMRIGGVSGWLRAAAIASAAGIPMSTHLYPEIAAHLMRVTDTAHWLEWQDWADPVLQEPYEIKNGFLHMPDRPGQGITWNEKAVAKYSY
ncbi:enolase C-terminal domain-like protein [Variovorax sp. J22R133]|uniref:enolase C-terminal domain-like protein n=1 Tax=Variovorax brevis TaxID=3053503 RepID=UPI00257749CA|nr:enolase C-terminal domain-like protein [Variovorax sp. J22R133]MDM0110633.1 enolase C-terminal domain-like protein [Variovorax sp. J22R133]